MRSLFPMLLILFFGCSQPKDTETIATSSAEAEKIVFNSIEKHGGRASWENLKSISYNKITVLFDSTGSKESSIVQRHLYTLKPTLEATIKWIENGDSVKIIYKDSEATKYVNGILDSSSAIASKGTVDAALYVLFQPFKLTDGGTSLQYLGKDSLDGRSVNIVRPGYSGQNPGDDEWLFYFDAITNELIANLVNHKGRRSLIKNIASDFSIPLYLHQHRKSYFVDSMMNIQYLRAEYFYTNYKLDFVKER